MKTKELDKQKVIEIGKKLAKANFIKTYSPRSHSHDVFSLFPQTDAQYRWLKRECGTTRNLVIIYTAEEVLKEVPELQGYVTPTKSGRFCRIKISL